MSDKYIELSRIKENLYIDDSPVIIEAGALLKNTQDNSILCHFRLKNIYNDELNYCKIAIKEIKVDGTEVDNFVEYYYLDLSVFPGNTFGDREPIRLTDPLTRQIDVCVIEAKYQNGLIWASPFCNWLPLPQRESLKSYSTDYSIVHQYEIEVGGNATYIPKMINGAFFCTCGEISCIKICNKCGRKYEDLANKLDREDLKLKASERLVREEAERQEQERIRIENEAKEEEQRRLALIQNKKKRKKRAIISIAVLSFVSIVFCIYYFFSPITSPALCFHHITELTCVDDSYCTRCGKIFTTSLGHYFAEATCTEPRTCKTCGLKRGEAAGHIWVRATCTKPSTCKNCHLEQGEPRGHSFYNGKCSRAGCEVYDFSRIIDITEFNAFNSNSSDVFKFSYSVTNCSSVTISSVRLTVQCLSSSGTVLINKNNNRATILLTGAKEVTPGETVEMSPQNAFENELVCNNVTIASLEIIFKDGTTLSLNSKECAELIDDNFYK